MTQIFRFFLKEHPLMRKPIHNNKKSLRKIVRIDDCYFLSNYDIMPTGNVSKINFIRRFLLYQL